MNPSKEEFDGAIRIVISAWNAVVMDSWDNGNQFESLLLSCMAEGPKQAQVEIKRLIKRKKSKFRSDPRAVGEHWIREENGKWRISIWL